MSTAVAATEAKKKAVPCDIEIAQAANGEADPRDRGRQLGIKPPIRISPLWPNQGEDLARYIDTSRG
jgi:hypothetical protein